MRSLRLCLAAGGFFSANRPTRQESVWIAFLAFIRVLVYALFLLIGSWLVLARPNLTTWLLFIACLCTAPFAVTSAVTVPWGATWYAISEALMAEPIVLGSLFLLLFVIAFPDAKPPHGWRRTAFLAGCAIVIRAAGYRLYVVVAASTMIDVLDDPISLGIIRGSTYAVVLMTIGRLFAMRPAERARFAWVAFGVVVGVIANDLRTKTGNDVVTNVAGFATVIMPVSVFYAILRRHVLDVRFVISRTVVYGVLTTLVIGVIGAVDWATSAFLSQYRVALVIDALVTIALGFVLHRLYGVTESLVDFLVYRRKHEAEAYLHRLARSLMRAQHEETVDHALIADPYDKFRLSMSALFRQSADSYRFVRGEGCGAAEALVFERDHDIVRFLQTERNPLHIADLRAHVTAQFIEAGAHAAQAMPLFEGDGAHRVCGIRPSPRWNESRSGRNCRARNALRNRRASIPANRKPPLSRAIAAHRLRLIHETLTRLSVGPALPRALPGGFLTFSGRPGGPFQNFVLPKKQLSRKSTRCRFSNAPPGKARGSAGPTDKPP